jgi:hypothetical protein
MQSRRRKRKYKGGKKFRYRAKEKHFYNNSGRLFLYRQKVRKKGKSFFSTFEGVTKLIASFLPGAQPCVLQFSGKWEKERKSKNASK